MHAGVSASAAGAAAAAPDALNATTRSHMPAPGAPRFFSYSPAGGISRPSSYTPAICRGPAAAASGRAGHGGAPGDAAPGTQQHAMFFEGLSRPPTSPLLGAKHQGMAATDDRLLASMQNLHATPMRIEGIASTGVRSTRAGERYAAMHGLGEAMRSSVLSSPAAYRRSLAFARGGAAASTAGSGGGGAAAEQPATATATERSRAEEAEGPSARCRGAESPAPKGESSCVLNTSPPLMRYVATKDGCVEKLQDTLQPTTVPAVAAAAMAAAKEAVGKNARWLQKEAPEEAFEGGDHLQHAGHEASK